MTNKIKHVCAIIFTVLAMLLSVLIFVIPLKTQWWWLVAGIILTVIAFYLIPPITRRLINIARRKRERRYLHSSYKQIKKKLKLPNNIYQTSWFFACEHGNAQEDFSTFHRISVPNLPANISVFHVDGALIWLINQHDGYDTGLFIEWLKEIRPKQPVNGTMLILDAFSLIQRTHKQTDALIEDFKHSCEDLYHQSDVLSPLHVFIAGLNKLDGMSEAIYEQSNFAELSIDLSVLANEKQTTFSKAYDQLFKSLFVANIQQISLQLDDDFKRKQLLGPMQLQYLKLSIEQLLQQLLSFDGADLPYDLTSLHLVESEAVQQRINLATAHALISVNQANLPAVQGANLKARASLQKAFTHGVLAKSFKAPVNQWQVFSYWLKQGLMTTAGLALLSFVAWVGYLNYQYNESLHAQFDQVHKNYKKTLNAQTFDIEQPSTILAPLTVLQRAYQEFQRQEQQKPWYVLPFIASIEREKHYQALYQKQLITLLQPTVIHYLEEELFVYLELEDYLTVLNIENVYQSFASGHAKNQEIVSNYLQDSFINSGVMSRDQVKEFTILLNDLYSLSYPSVDVNNELVAIVDAELSTLNRFQLLYQYIETLPEFNKLNDVRSTLFGQDTPQSGGKDILYFDESHASFLVPNLYTPGGLLQLSFIPDSGFFQTMVKDNHGLFKKIPEPRDLERLGSYLKYTYINEYVGFWRNYLAHIKAREGIQLKALLTQLTQEEKSPLAQLNKGIRHFVNIPLITIDKPDEASVQAPKKLAAKLKKVEAVTDKLVKEKVDLKQLMALEQNDIATKINQAFDDDILLSGTNKQVDAIYDALHKDLVSLKKWLDTADNEVIPGKAYFEDFTEKKSYQSFSNLWLNSYDQTLIDNLVLDIIETTSHYVENKVASYLNNQWNNQVFSPYQQELAPYFPFKQSKTSVEVRKIDKFFATDSALAQYEQNVLSQFVENNGQKQLALFNRQHIIKLDSSLTQFLNTYKTIREELYNGADKITVNITYTPVSMAPEMMSFSLATAKSSLNYTHGPLIGVKTSWPSDYQDSELTVTFVDSNNQKTTRTYQGIWAPMQFVAANTSGEPTDIVSIPYLETAGVKLKINNLHKPSNIINPAFFSRLNVPKQVVSEPKESN